jgi:hypothetical protein
VSLIYWCRIFLREKVLESITKLTASSKFFLTCIHKMASVTYITSLPTSSRQELEFEVTAKSVLVIPTLRKSVPIEFTLKLTNTLIVQLHNALIISLFDATVILQGSPTPTFPKPPPTKRSRLFLPYQGPDTTRVLSGLHV